MNRQKTGILPLLLSVVFPMWLSAQDFDRLYLSAQNLTGTARYVGMGGAFTALGGDVSAVKDNPAGLGVFRRGEISISFGGKFDNAAVGESGLVTSCFSVPQLSWVMTVPNGKRQSGVISNNFMLGYHRLNTFNRDAAYRGIFSSSQTDVMAVSASGFSAVDMQDYYVWSNDTIGWLPAAGAQGGLITQGSSGNWQPILDENEQVESRLNIIESGSSNEYSASWGMNISHKVYVGAGISLRTMNQRRDISYSENFENGGSYSLHTTVINSGIGWGVAAGVLYRPTNYLRMGLSILSPTWYNMKFSNRFDLNSTEASVIVDPLMTNTYTISHYQLPMRTTAGLALQLREKGLLSFEYDYSHQVDKALQDVHTLKAGAEWVVGHHCFLHAGYAYQSDFRKADYILLPGSEDTRTDTDFKNIKACHWASIGCDFRNAHWVAGIAYQFKLEQSHVYAHEFQEGNPFELSATTHCIVVSLAWRY